MRSMVIQFVLIGCLTATTRANTATLVDKGRALARDNNYDGARRALEQAVKEAPADWEALSELGLVYLHLDKQICPGEAKRHCRWLDNARETTRAAIDNARNREQRAMAEYNLGLIEEEWDYTAAEAAFGRSLALRPNASVAARRVAVVARLKRDAASLAGFQSWVTDWARRNHVDVADWWTANLEIGEATDKAALLCNGPGRGAYLVEDGAGRRFAFGFAGEDWPRICLEHQPEGHSPMRITAWRTIHYDHAFRHDALIADLALRRGQLVLVRFSQTLRNEDGAPRQKAYDWDRLCAKRGDNLARSPEITGFEIQHPPGEPCFPAASTLSPEMFLLQP
jgi:tetratricopeptide (TPR) repeat protein